jgi:hypothetical protein
MAELDVQPQTLQAIKPASTHQRRALQLINQPCGARRSGRQLRMKASVGITMWPSGGTVRIIRRCSSHRDGNVPAIASSRRVTGTGTAASMSGSFPAAPRGELRTATRHRRRDRSEAGTMAVRHGRRSRRISSPLISRPPPRHQHHGEGEES